MPSLTFYGGVNEIGGNKILLNFNNAYQIMLHPNLRTQAIQQYPYAFAFYMLSCPLLSAP